MKYKNSLLEFKSLKSEFNLNSFNHNIKKTYFLIILMLFHFTSEQYEISLVINGPGVHNFINEAFNLNPSEVIVNGDRRFSCHKSCDFPDGLNNVTIKYSEKINSCENMFKGMTNIVEIDLSKLDTSGVTSMSEMFRDCINLEKITFGNINTSSVNNMFYLFCGYIKLSSIDVSNFNTSSVITMEAMFSHCETLLSLDASSFNTKNLISLYDTFAYCYKLTSINVSSFDTSKVQIIRGIFYRCHDLKYLDLSNFDTSSVINAQFTFTDTFSLIYLNLYSFKYNSETSLYDSFLNTADKICIQDISTQTILSSEVSNFNCNDVCFKKNIKINLQNDQCVENCPEQGYKYEYKNFCYNQCPTGTYPIENGILCLDNTQKGYYLDNTENNLIYKQCYETCETCNKGGTSEIHNCQECKTYYTDNNEINHPFLYEFKLNDSINCYIKCPNGVITPENNNINNKHLCRPICTQEKPYEILFTQECVKICPFDKIKENKCILNYKTKNSEKDETKIKNDLLRIYEQGFTSPDFNTSNLENGEDEIFEHDGIIMTLTTTENQKKKRKQ